MPAVDVTWMMRFVPPLLRRGARVANRLRMQRGIGLKYRGTLATMLDRPAPPEASVMADWLKGYISQPHAKLGRSGAVCPFVPKAMRTERLHVVYHPEVDGRWRVPVQDVLFSHVESFQALFPEVTHEDEFNSLLIVFPGISPERGDVVDSVHTELKSVLMFRGVMLATFHPNSTKGAIRNNHFQAYGSPFPCIAVRHMGVHDIIFMGHNRLAFAEYKRRCGPRFERGDVGDEHGYLTLYREACARFPNV